MISIHDRIIANNPWWGNIKFIEDDSLIVEFNSWKYRYFHPLLDHFPLDKDAILTIRGPRRVGKSTLFRLFIKKLLLEEKIPKEAVFFYPCDRVKSYDDLYEIIKTYLDFARPRTSSRLFLFLDEVSFVPDWQRAIKEMTDSGLLKNAMVLLTGSSILDLKFGSEFLSGRRGISPADIFYHPLNFRDFVKLVSPDIDSEDNSLALFHQLPKLHKLYDDYLITGGFPKTINEYFSLGRIDTSTYETFLTWVENDIHKTRRSEQTAYDLIANIIRTATSQVSYTSLAKDSNMASHFAAQEYIDILEKMFILFPLPAFVIEEKKRDSKKNKKIYFTDPFIFNSLYLKTSEQMGDPFNQSLKIVHMIPAGILAENMTALHLKMVFPSLYWGKMKKGEIDFAGKKENKLRLFEVKYQERIDFGEIPRLPEITIISKKTLNDKPLNTIPLEIFLLHM